MEEFTREPCPWRVFDDAGGAFAMGVGGGSIYHSYIGFSQAAKGQALINMFREVRMRAPMTGTQFAAWGCVFSSVDCTITKLRGKEDMMNSIVAGAVTGGVLTMRSGLTASLVSAAVGGVLLGVIEGFGAVMTRFSSPQFDPTLVQPPQEPSQLPPVKQPSSSMDPITAPFGMPQHMSG